MKSSCNNQVAGLTTATDRREAAAHPVAEVVVRLSDTGIPAAEIQSVAQAWASPQAVERGLASDAHHPVLGRLHVPEQPVHFSGIGRGNRTAAPALNADADDILATLTKKETA